MGQHILSKSSFIKGLQCEKQLYLYKNHYDWRDPLDANLQAVFKRGTNVGVLAQKLFPHGESAQIVDPTQSGKAVKLTKELIDSKIKTIYEAAFIFDDVLVISDIIEKYNNKWNVYEVKSSTSVSETYIMDAAIQYYVLSHAGLKINDFSIIFINNQYVRIGKLDINSLFSIEPVKNLILDKQDFIKSQIKKFKKVLKEKEIPDIKIGPHCRNPYDCSFIGYCWKNVPEYSVFDIAGLRLEKKFELYNNGIVDIKDIPKDFKLSANQRIQVQSHAENEKLIDKAGIKEFLKSLNYPLYFMDFETFMPAVPMFDKSRPYQQIPFQYSLHYKRDKFSEVKHFEFLADAAGDPREKFIEKLLFDTDRRGDIIVYNQAFEITRLKEIGRDFPEYLDEIELRIARIKDLMIPFQKKYYYSPEMKGSFSIKYVLPALIPEMSYEGMPISEGGAASMAFERLFYETDLFKTEEIRKNLLEYCKMDTLAMVKVLEFIGSIK